MLRMANQFAGFAGSLGRFSAQYDLWWENKANMIDMFLLRRGFDIDVMFDAIEIGLGIGNHTPDEEKEVAAMVFGARTAGVNSCREAALAVAQFPNQPAVRTAVGVVQSVHNRLVNTSGYTPAGVCAWMGVAAVGTVASLAVSPFLGCAIGLVASSIPYLDHKVRIWWGIRKLRNGERVRELLREREVPWRSRRALQQFDYVPVRELLEGDVTPANSSHLVVACKYARLAQSKFVYPSHTPSNEKMVGQWISKEMIDHGLRPAHQALILPWAIKLTFVRSETEMDAADLLRLVPERIRNATD
jgi:hypothetical protein